MRTYRTGLLLALIGNIVLAAVVAGLWWHYHVGEPVIRAETPSANTTGQVSTEQSAGAPPVSAENFLVPVQISAQRLQSIGVKTGQVEGKQVQNEIRTTGTVAVDETKMAYVKGLLFGVFQEEFLDAT